MKIGILGASLLFDSTILNDLCELEIVTPYGAVPYKSGTFKGKEIVFIPREGVKNPVPPHLFNYRGNIWAMKKLGVHSIISVMAAGSVNESMKLGDFVFPSQFIDFTKSRIGTFYEGGERGVVHVDVTSPYCQRLSQDLLVVAKKCNIPAHAEATFVCYEGPRFQTPAEIAMVTKLGGDLVGMTSVPEVVLAREAEMCYASVAMVGSIAIARKSTLSRDEVIKIMRAGAAKVNGFIAAALDSIDTEADCPCQHALAEYGGFKL